MSTVTPLNAFPPEPPASPLLAVDKLSLEYRTPGRVVRATHEVSFDVHAGDRFVLLGASGCGKSSLLKAVAGFLPPSDGEIRLDGRPISGPGPDRIVVFQEFDQLPPWKTVKDNVIFPLRATGTLGRKEAAERALHYLDKVGLAAFADAYPHTLSGGMKQRVAIARALANEPRILLMDEPFGALDALTRCKMQNYLMQIWRKVEVTILFITHDLEEACYLADRIVVMGSNPGRVVEVIENPIPRPRTSDLLLSPEFLGLKRRLEELIHAPAEAEEERLPMIKMTEAGDEVE